MSKIGLEIKTDGSVNQVEWNDYKDIQKYVGGYFEEIPVDDVMICLNEDGLSNNLEYNKLATGILLPITGYPAVGNVFVTGKPSHLKLFQEKYELD